MGASAARTCRIGAFYHAYLVNRWEEIVTEHLDALESSGLASELEVLYLGIVGHPDEKTKLVKLCQARLPIEIVGQADRGWEQITLRALWERAGDFDVLAYHHTTGVTYDLGEMPYGGYASQEAFNHAWRESMTRATISRWRECVRLLGTHEVVGCHWIVHPAECVGSAGESVEADTHFMGGNFWWARATTIGRFAPPRMRHRYDAEMWLGHNGVTDVFDLTPGWPALESFNG